MDKKSENSRENKQGPPASSKPQSSTKPPNGDEAAVGTWWTKRETFVSFIAGSIAVVSAFLTTWFWLDNKINREVQERIEPYETYFAGVSFVEDQEYDKAIPQLEIAFDAMRERLEQQDDVEIDEKLLPVVDYYLYAIVNSEDPSDYSSEANELIRMIENKVVAPNGYHYHHLGWYYFRTGDLKEAREHFTNAVREYNLDAQYVVAADTYWALALVDVAEGKIDSAVSRLDEASERNPAEYDPEIVATYESRMSEDPWFRTLNTLYPKFESSTPAFLERIEKLRANREPA